MDTRRSVLQKLAVGGLALMSGSKLAFSSYLSETSATGGRSEDKYVVKVNCAGPAVDGFSADQPYRRGSWGYIHGGQYFQCDSVSNDYGIAKALSTLRYSCGAPFHYLFDVRNGYYRVKMYFVSPNEFYGQRVFDIVLNGNIVLAGFRPFPVNVAVLKQFEPCAVTNGQLDITFRSINDACLANAIEVEQISSALPPKPAAVAKPASGNHPRTSHDNLLISYYGDWTRNGNSHHSNIAGNALDFAFKGSTIKWLGARGPNHGTAEVYLDGVLHQTVDTYAASFTPNAVLYENNGLSQTNYHTIRIVVAKDQHPDSSGSYQDVGAFECQEAFDAAENDADSAFREVATIEASEKACLAPSHWRPVPNAAVVPEGGVRLHDGVLQLAFARNVAYQTNNWNMSSSWTTWLPGANLGRRMAGAGNLLRWVDHPELRRRLDSLVESVASQQRADGYALPYAESDMGKVVYGANNERKPYDRRNFSLGLVAAGWVNPSAYQVARRFQDWLYASPYISTMLDGALGIMGDQPNLSMYHSPVGTEEDVIVREKYWRQDWWLEQLRNQQPAAISRFPLNRAHSYVIAPWISYVDAYRATGDQSCIEAMLGAWQTYREHFTHVGGSAAICEDCDNAYPYKSYYLGKHTGENCGGALWIEFNHRLLQLYPDREAFASEIEQTLYNVTVANQDASGNLRYHTNLVGTKDAAKAIGTCCEVTNTTILARLPGFLYSISSDGLYVNMYAPSSIQWKHGGSMVTIETSAGFPEGTAVSMKLVLDSPLAMKLRLRIPSWATGDVRVSINGEQVGGGVPGTYVTLDRTWVRDDQITFDIPAGFRLTKYTGFDRDRGYDRYALRYGPLLLSLLGATHLNVTPKELIDRLVPISGGPLQFSIEGNPGCRYVPYFQIQDETFTSFPTLV
jgi:hypothetical protein